MATCMRASVPSARPPTNGPLRAGSRGLCDWRECCRDRGSTQVTRRPNSSGGSPGATAWDWGCATGSNRSPQDNRRDLALLDELVERRDVGVEHRFQPIELHLQRRRQLAEYLLRLRRRRCIGTPYDACQRRDLVVQADRVVQRILARAVLHLIDRLLDRGEPALDRVGQLRDTLGGVAGETAGARRRTIELLADLADPPDGVVRGAYAVANLQQQVELRLITRRRRLHPWIGQQRELARLRPVSDRQPHLVRTGHRHRPRGAP